MSHILQAWSWDDSVKSGGTLQYEQCFRSLLGKIDVI